MADKYTTEFDKIKLSLNTIVATIKTGDDKFPVVVSKNTRMVDYVSGIMDKAKLNFEIDEKTFSKMKSIERMALDALLGLKFKGWDVTPAFLEYFQSPTISEIIPTGKRFVSTLSVDDQTCTFFDKDREILTDVFDVGNFFSAEERYTLVLTPSFLWFAGESKLGITWKILQVSEIENKG